MCSGSGKILRAFRIGEERDLPISIEFILNLLVCLFALVAGESQVFRCPLTSSLLDPLHHRPALPRAACIAALTTSTLPAL